VEQIPPSPELRPNQLYPIDIARKFLGNIGRTKFYDEVAKGQIEIVKIGSRSLATVAGLIRYIDRLRASA
jgi:hypothetical protein